MTGQFKGIKYLGMQNAGAKIHGVSGLDYDGNGWYHTTDFDLGELYAKLLQGEPGVAVMNLGRRGEKPQPQVSLHLTHLPLLPGFELEPALGELRCPEFLQQWWWDELYDHQLEAIRRVRQLGGVIEADFLGGGKTRTCIGAAKPPVVVLCKKSDAFVWKSELTYAEVPFAVIGSRQVGLQVFEDHKDALFWIIPYSVAPSWVPYFADVGLGPTARTVIADEAHEVQNRHTKAAEALRTLSYERGMFVSATAQRNRLQSLWGILDLSCTGRPFGSHWEFRERYCGAKHSGYGLEDGTPSPEMVAQLRKRIAPIVIKRTKKQIGQVLPPMERRLHRIEMAPEARKFLLESVGQLMDPEIFHAEGGKGGQHLVAINAFRRAVGTQKAMLAIDVLANRVFEWGRGVIWVHHKEVGQLLKVELKHRGIDVAVIQGSTSLKTREEIAQDWKHGVLRPEKPKALVASISAANTALSFTTCGYQAFLEYDWSNIQMMQAEARLNRTGQQHPNILSEYFVIPGTIDEHLGRVVVEKAREAEAVLGEDGQVDQVQTILGSEEESDADFMKRLALRLAAGE